MTEIAARLPRPRGLAPLLVAIGVLAAVAVAAALTAKLHHAKPGAHARAERRHPVPLEPGGPAAPALPAGPAAPLPTGVLDAEASRSFDRGYFVASRAGVLSTTRRVAGWRRLALRAAAARAWTRSSSRRSSTPRAVASRVRSPATVRA